MASESVTSREGALARNSGLTATRSPSAVMLRRSMRSRSTQIGVLLVVLITVLSIFAPLLSSFEPNQMAPMSILQGPSMTHKFGTDDFGRDILTRVLYGGRISIFVGVVVALVTGLFGVLIGTITGYYSRVDGLIMRVMDALMAFPAILLAIGIMSILGPRLSNIIAALAIVYTPRCARVARGTVLALRDQEYIQAARAMGMHDLRIMLKHLVPNSIAPVLVQQTFILSAAVIAESSLNFLGVGVPPNIPTLGSILSDSRTFLRDAPWMSIFPGVFISVLVLGFNLLGDGLRDVFDPRIRL